MASVGQLIVEPKGSTYHDPKTGAVIASGALADIWTANPLAPGVPGSFRELALWTIDNHRAVGCLDRTCGRSPGPTAAGRPVAAVQLIHTR